MSTITPLQAIRLTHNVLLKQLITKGRLIGITIIGLLPILLGWVIGRQSDDPLEELTEEELALWKTGDEDVQQDIIQGADWDLVRDKPIDDYGDVEFQED